LLSKWPPKKLEEKVKKAITIGKKKEGNCAEI
jgi:hypothetical protein